MRNALIVMLYAAFLYAVVDAQTIHGTITGTNSDPVADVRVSIPVLHRTVWSDAAGQYSLTDVHAGSYIIVFTKVGYAEETATITVTDADHQLDQVMSVSPVALPAVTVTAPSGIALLNNGPNHISVLTGTALDRTRNGGVMQALSWTPGVALFSGGTMSVKPVVRGFTAQRIVTAADGVRHTAQTWDEPQSAEIDAMDVDRIEVVHGPAGLLFGPEAMGGVINIVRQDLFQMSAPHLLDGTVMLDLNSGNTGAAASAALYGSADGYRYRASFSGRYAGDYSAPAGKSADGVSRSAGAVFNSGAEEFNASLRTGRQESWGTWQAEYAHFGQFYYISPEPGRKEYELNIHTGLYDSLPAAPRQEIIHERLGGKFTMPMDAGILDIAVTAQYNSRREEGVSESEEDEQLKNEKGIKPEAMLDLYSIMTDVRFHHRLLSLTDGTIGVSLESERNQTLGVNAIIPAYTSSTMSAFLVEEAPLTSWMSLTGGVRLDRKGMSVRRNDSLRIADATLSNTAVNGSAAVVFRPWSASSVVLSYTTGWRAPSASELYTYGKDEGTIRFKTGNAALVPELARNLGLTLSHRTSKVQTELNLYRSTVQDYIYLDPAGTNINGMPVYSYRQTDATLTGGDVSAAWSVTDDLILRASYEWLETKNTVLNSALPLEPADRVISSVEYHVFTEAARGDWSVSSLTAAVNVKQTAAQMSVTALERTTPAYTIVDLAFSGDAQCAGQPVHYILSGENILNTAYYDHLSRYKEFALNPGIAVLLKLQTPVTIFP